MKKLLALLLAIVMILPLVACGGGGSDDETDSGYQSAIKNVYNVKDDSKTTIKFKNAGGGYGHLWIDIAAEKFAEMHKDTEFETGKKGVYIEVLNDFTFGMATMNSTSQQIIMGGFSSASDLASLDILYDIDSIVRDNTREGGSLESKILDTRKDASQHNGKYYAVPFTEYYGGLSYNHEIFEEIDAFFADPTQVDPDSDDFEMFTSKYSAQGYEWFTNENGPLSVGPDGQPDTADDGMPVSMEQFLVLMDFIKTYNYAPIVLSGAYTNYSMYLADGFFGSLAGYDKMRNYYNSRGEVEVVEVDATDRVIPDESGDNILPGIDYIKKPKTKPVTLNDNNGYMSSLMVEKYYTYALFEILKREGFWSEDTNDPQIDHYGAQNAFLLGSNGGYKENAAMICEATYWYNEARDADLFRSMEFINGKTEETIDIRPMCLPSNIYTEGAVGKATSLTNIGAAYLMINGNVKNSSGEEAVIEFFKYLLSEKQLQEYTVVTGMALSLDYDMGDFTCEALGTTYKMSNYYKKLWDLRKTDGSNVISCSGNTPAFIRNCGALKLDLWSPNFAVDNVRNPKSTVEDQGVDTCFIKSRILPSQWSK